MKTGIKINRLLKLHNFVAILFFILLFFGKTFTKIPVFSSLFLYDFLLIIIFGLSFFKIKRKLQLPIIIIPIIISVLYFIISIMKHYNTEHLTFVIRQYATFIYIIIAYFLANKFFTSKDRVNLAIRFIYLFSKVSVVVQSVFLIISLMTGYSNNTAVEGHRYISPIVVLGVITYGAYVIVYKEKLLFKLVSVILTFILLFSTGHASAFLSFLVILLFNFFLKINIKQRVIGIVVVILLIMFLYAFPQFRDVNASWRLIYWGHVINNIFLENFSLFGNGFGEPYSTYEFAIGLNKTHNSYVLANTYKPYSRWLIGPHNSFLTIMFIQLNLIMI